MSKPTQKQIEAFAKKLYGIGAREANCVLRELHGSRAVRMNRWIQLHHHVYRGHRAVAKFILSNYERKR